MKTKYIGRLLLCSLLLVPATHASAQGELNHDVTPQISVTGEGKAEAKPDMAQIHVGVVTEGKTAVDAVKQNNQAMQMLIDSLKQQGVEAKQIQTSGFHVSPRYQHDERGQNPEIVGYEVVNEVRISVHNLEQLGELLDSVMQAGANRIHGIQFMVEEQTAILETARREAIRNARQKAELFAAAAGVRVGKPLVIDESVTDQPQPMNQRYFAAAEVGGVPIETGQQMLQVQVRVTYELSYDE